MQFILSSWLQSLLNLTHLCELQEGFESNPLLLIGQPYSLDEEGNDGDHKETMVFCGCQRD